jgi:hypothetical protein
MYGVWCMVYSVYTTSTIIIYMYICTYYYHTTIIIYIYTYSYHTIILLQVDKLLFILLSLIISNIPTTVTLLSGGGGAHLQWSQLRTQARRTGLSGLRGETEFVFFQNGEETMAFRHYGIYGVWQSPPSPAVSF